MAALGFSFTEMTLVQVPCARGFRRFGGGFRALAFGAERLYPFREFCVVVGEDVFHARIELFAKSLLPV